MDNVAKYEAIVIGASAGGLAALTTILTNLPERYGIPIVIVQHRGKDSADLFEDVLQRKCKIRIRQADEKEPVKAGIAYVAPPDYHLLVEMDKTFSLSADPPVQFSRPSIDVLFESAAFAFGKKLVAILLTGSNNDGASGISVISSLGGLTIAQDPAEAEYDIMPKAAIEAGRVKYVWRLADISNYLKDKG